MNRKPNKLISFLAKFPLWVNSLITFIILIGISVLLAFVKNEITRYILLVCLFLFLMLSYSILSVAHIQRHTEKKLKNASKHSFPYDSLEEFSLTLKKNHFEREEENPNLITYKKKMNGIRYHISFVEDFHGYCSYLESIRQEEDSIENTPTKDHQGKAKDVRMNCFCVLIRGESHEIQEYVYKNSFSMNHFGLLFFYLNENKELCTYLEAVQDQEVLDSFYEVLDQNQ